MIEIRTGLAGTRWCTTARRSSVRPAPFFG